MSGNCYFSPDLLWERILSKLKTKEFQALAEFATHRIFRNHSRYARNGINKKAKMLANIKTTLKSALETASTNQIHLA
jgi:hypothetical protein